jgi:hypothetical protein
MSPRILIFGIRSRWSVSVESNLTSTETVPDSHWTGYCVGPRAGLDVAAWRRMSAPIGNPNPIEQP